MHDSLRYNLADKGKLNKDHKQRSLVQGLASIEVFSIILLFWSLLTSTTDKCAEGQLQLKYYAQT
jgi:hypothetical protein